jgi:CheY-like chemotaxis protein
MDHDTHKVRPPAGLRVDAETLMSGEEADDFGIHLHDPANLGLSGLPETEIETDFEDNRGRTTTSWLREWLWTTLELPLRPRILLAEDDAEMRELITSELEHAGYEVVPCRDGMQLLDCVSSIRTDDDPLDFDLIVSDIRMPGVDGLSLLEGLRQWAELRPLQMILMTAFGDESIHRRARELGAVAVFDKPFQMVDLLAKVAEILPSPRALAGESTAATVGRVLVCSDSLPGGSLWGVLSVVDDLDDLPHILLFGSPGSHESFEQTLHTKFSHCGQSPMEIVRELGTLVG